MEDVVCIYTALGGLHTQMAICHKYNDTRAEILEIIDKATKTGRLYELGSNINIIVKIAQ